MQLELRAHACTLFYTRCTLRCDDDDDDQANKSRYCSIAGLMSIDRRCRRVVVDVGPQVSHVVHALRIMQVRQREFTAMPTKSIIIIDRRRHCALETTVKLDRCSLRLCARVPSAQRRRDRFSVSYAHACV